MFESADSLTESRDTTASRSRSYRKNTEVRTDLGTSPTDKD